VRVAPDGTILSSKVTKSSGVKAWDDAVVRAIEKTEILPRDTDGTIPPTMTIVFRPHDL
jgi:colicin import membrane protein